ncbi:ATPase, T2SS/T4P/T4SS family, partial [Rhodobacteraceae bacterium]|nr:ATPase, T2SS/T4P/T4SS family [Paracoccaceae bacterium]
MAFGRVKKETAQSQQVASSDVVPADVARLDTWRDAKSRIRSALVDVLDSSDFSDESRADAVARIRPIVEVIVRDQDLAVTPSDLDRMCRELIDEIVGFGPLEQLIARDDIADIMVNGHKTVYIEVNGRVEVAPISFSSDEQLLQICQRIVRQVGRRIDESSPICDARLLDGSRVNVIIPPLAIDGPVLTIRKFKKDRLKLDDLVKFRSITRPG